MHVYGNGIITSPPYATQDKAREAEIVWKSGWCGGGERVRHWARVQTTNRKIHKPFWTIIGQINEDAHVLKCTWKLFEKVFLRFVPVAYEWEWSRTACWWSSPDLSLILLLTTTIIVFHRRIRNEMWRAFRRAATRLSVAYFSFPLYNRINFAFCYFNWQIRYALQGTELKNKRNGRPSKWNDQTITSKRYVLNPLSDASEPSPMVDCPREARSSFDVRDPLHLAFDTVSLHLNPLLESESYGRIDVKDSIMIFINILHIEVD